MNVGGWTTFSSKMSDEETAIFNAALDGLLGVKYTPVAVASQVVSGTNYCYFCNAQAVYPGATNEAATVHIYKPLSGDAHITEIKMTNA